MKKTLKLGAAWKNSLFNNTESILPYVYAETEFSKKKKNVRSYLKNKISDLHKQLSKFRQQQRKL